jgi:large subunit ribosomal protein L17
MRRGNKRKFGRTAKQRHALMVSLATALIEHKRIKTTSAKARALSKFADKLVTQARLPSLRAHRKLHRDLGKKAVKILISEIAPKLHDQHGGFTRIASLPIRQSDSARMALIEFTIPS